MKTLLMSLLEKTTPLLLAVVLFSTTSFAGNIYECMETGSASEKDPRAILHNVRVEEIGTQKLERPKRNYDYKVATEITVRVMRGNRLIESDTIYADATVNGVDYEVNRVSPNFRFWLYMDGLDQCGMDFISSRTGRLKRVNLACHWVAQ